MKLQLKACSIAALAIFAMSTGSARALTLNFSEPSAWSVGDPNTTYQLWAAGGSSAVPINTNLSVTTNPVLGSSPTLAATGAFISSSGGYYSFSANYNLDADVPNHGGLGGGTKIIVQTAATVNPDYDPEGDGTGGSLLRDTLKILDGDGNLLVLSDPTEVVRTYYDPNYPLFGGVQYEELRWEVFLPGYTGDFSFQATEMVHSSLQALRIDSFITPVPESSTLALVGMGLVGGIGLVWRRRSTR